MAEPSGVHFDLSILLCLVKGVRILNLRGVRSLFEILKMFYPPKGPCEAEPEWGTFDILSIYCV